MNSAGSSIWGILVCVLATGSHRRQLPLTVACYRWGTLLMSRHCARRLNLFQHLQKPQARTLHLATHTSRRLTSTRQNTWIHQHQNRYPAKNALATLRRHGLSAHIRRTAVTQVPRLRFRLRSGTKKSYCTKLARFGSCLNLLDSMTCYTMKVTGWNSEMVRHKRSDGSGHRLIELKHVPGRIKVGKVYASVDRICGRCLSTGYCVMSVLMEVLPINAQYRCLTLKLIQTTGLSLLTATGRSRSRLKF